MIIFSNSVQKYIYELLLKKKNIVGIRIIVRFPGTIRAECSMEFCSNEDISIISDKKIVYKYFNVYICKSLLIFLKDAKVDLIDNNLGKRITLNAPFSKSFTNLNKNSSLEEKIQHFLFTKINPKISLHGGKVVFIKINKMKYVELQFFGSCNGCNMINTTLKEGIENELIQVFPDIKGVKDVTIHEYGNHSYC